MKCSSSLQCSSSLLRTQINFFLPPRNPASSCTAVFGRTESVGFYRPVLSAQLPQKTLPLSKFFLPPRIPASSCPASFSRTGFLASCGPAINTQLPQKALPLFKFFLPLTPKTSCSINQICSKPPTAGILFNVLIPRTFFFN